MDVDLLTKSSLRICDLIEFLFMMLLRSMLIDSLEFEIYSFISFFNILTGFFYDFVF